MSGTDFFDDDLVRQDDSRARPASAHAEAAASSERQDLPQASGEAIAKPVSDLNLTRMARRREEMDSQVAGAIEQLELLRRRQEDIEKAKRDLEELRRMQDDYARGKREMTEKLNRRVVEFEKAEIQAERMAEVYSELRKRFKTSLAELHEINDEKWPEDKFREELEKALAAIEGAKEEYNRGIARVEAMDGGAGPALEGGRSLYGETAGGPETERGFWYWIKIGFAVTLPLAVLIAVLMGVFFGVMRMSGVL